MGARSKKPKIGIIPEKWEIVRLGDPMVTEAIYYGVTAKACSYKTELKMLRTTDIKCFIFDYQKLPYCEITDSRNKINQYKLFEGDIIVARAGTVGVSILVDKNYEDVIFGSYLIKVKLKKEAIYPRYIHYFFQSYIFWNHIKKAQGSTLKNINLPLLRSLTLPLPPLPEQKKIAEILGAVDEAIEKVDESIAKTERLKKGLMQELLTKGIGHKEVKDTEIGRIPKEWEVVRLGEVCAQKKEIVLPKGDGRTNFIGLEHLESGKIKVKSFSTDLGIKSSKFKFCRGDILYGKLRPYLDKVVIAEIEGVCSTDLIVLSPDEGKCVKEFLIYVLHSKMFIRHAISNTSGTNHPRTSWKAISEFEFGLPPLFEQKKIAEILSTVDKRLELLRNKKEKLVRIKKGLMNDLLTGKKRVRV